MCLQLVIMFPRLIADCRQKFRGTKLARALTPQVSHTSSLNSSRPIKTITESNRRFAFHRFAADFTIQRISPSSFDSAFLCSVMPILRAHFFVSLFVGSKGRRITASGLAQNVGGGHGFRISRGMDGSIIHVSCWAHNAFAAALTIFVQRSTAASQTPIDSIARKEKGTFDFPDEMCKGHAHLRFGSCSHRAS
jgi:hypothetical protein